MRNEGGSVGTSLAQTLEERREHFHTLRLNEWLTHFHPAVNLNVKQLQEFFFQRTGDADLSRHMGVQVIANIRQQQTASLAYFDCFWAFAVLASVLIVFVLLMKRSVAEKGARVSSE